MPENEEKTEVVVKLPDVTETGKKTVWIIPSDPPQEMIIQPQTPTVGGWKHGLVKIFIGIIITTIADQVVESGYNAAVKKYRGRKGR